MGKCRNPGLPQRKGAAPRTMTLRTFTLSDMIVRNARLHPDAAAFIVDGRRMTHAEYLQRVGSLAAGLAAIGVGQGDRIAVLAHNCIEYVELYGAAARLGAIILAVNWRLSADEIGYILTDGAPKVIVADAANQAAIKAAAAPASVQRYFGIGIGGGAEPFAPFGSLLGSAAPLPDTDVVSDGGFVIIPTAAVSGRPRGALLSQRGLVAASLQLIHHWGLNQDDVNLGALPLFHTSGLGLLLAVQMAGGATVLMSRFDAGLAVQHVHRERVTVFAEFPPMLGAVLDAATGTGELSSLRIVTGLDSPETIARLEAACERAEFWTGYGQSELSGLVTTARFRESRGSAGRPTILSSVAIVDDSDHVLPAGQTGEIVVRSPAVFEGYWNLEAESAAAFRNGWHHTGDLGRIDDKGWLWYVGRAPSKDLIKPGGENVYPAEVETVVRAHPAISDVVVLGVPDAQWGEAVKAVCVVSAGRSVTAAEVIAFVADRIARYKKPKHVVFVDALPRTAAGVIDRLKVKAEHGHA